MSIQPGRPMLAALRETLRKIERDVKMKLGLPVREEPESPANVKAATK